MQCHRSNGDVKVWKREATLLAEQLKETQWRLHDASKGHTATQARLRASMRDRLSEMADSQTAAHAAAKAEVGSFGISLLLSFHHLRLSYQPLTLY
jgi:hypothetical protein